MTTETEYFNNNIAADDDKIYNIIGVENQVFPTTFMALKVAGSWLPTTIKLRPLYFCYKLYTVFCFVCLCMLIVTLILDNALSDNKSLMVLVEYWYMLVIFINAIMKLINLLTRRDKIIHIMQMSIMEERWRLPRDKEEFAILEKSKRSEKLVTQCWFIMLFVNCINNALNPIIRENPNRILMYECYTPCDRRIPTCFWICYTYQCFGYGISSITHLGYDCLVFNFIERICAHLQIFKYRLNKLSVLSRQGPHEISQILNYEKSYLKQCLIDYRSIHGSAREVNETFYEMVFIQFLLSISVLCTNIYVLSKQDLFSPGAVAVFFYLCCVLVQNFFYCWYGYKLTQHSCSVVFKIYSLDWTVLQNETKKMLLFLMVSASDGIELFNNAIVNLSPEMFLKLVKVSYSAFNLLQQSYKK